MTWRLLAMLGGLVLGFATAPGYTLDPPTARGHLQYGQQRYELRHVQAVRNPNDPRRLWIVVTTAELSVKEAADASRVLGLAMTGKLRGARLSVDAAVPKATELQVALLLSKEESPGGEVVFGAGGRKYWDRLILGDKRIVGTLRFATEASSPPWALEVDFSAPIFSAR